MNLPWEFHLWKFWRNRCMLFARYWKCSFCYKEYFYAFIRMLIVVSSILPQPLHCSNFRKTIDSHCCRGFFWWISNNKTETFRNAFSELQQMFNNLVIHNWFFPSYLGPTEWVKRILLLPKFLFFINKLQFISKDGRDNKVGSNRNSIVNHWTIDSNCVLNHNV